eukprot:TRINITY_DN1043_c3_g1_i2.p1 TRINITY_DN1043_c3_g1~~TRINITY_DN1043_c3_g1_i2.p1  ORF type:complete len:1908 (+),score=420.29 TRINITY_DN1043_c3_g1_i2:108-5831(+)
MSEETRTHGARADVGRKKHDGAAKQQQQPREAVAIVSFNSSSDGGPPIDHQAAAGGNGALLPGAGDGNSADSNGPSGKSRFGGLSRDNLDPFKRITSFGNLRLKRRKDEEREREKWDREGVADRDNIQAHPSSGSAQPGAARAPTDASTTTTTVTSSTPSTTTTTPIAAVGSGDKKRIAGGFRTRLKHHAKRTINSDSDNNDARSSDSDTDSMEQLSPQIDDAPASCPNLHSHPLLAGIRRSPSATTPASPPISVLSPPNTNTNTTTTLPSSPSNTTTNTTSPKRFTPKLSLHSTTSPSLPAPIFDGSTSTPNTRRRLPAPSLTPRAHRAASGSEATAPAVVSNVRGTGRASVEFGGVTIAPASLSPTTHHNTTNSTVTSPTLTHTTPTRRLERGDTLSKYSLAEIHGMRKDTASTTPTPARQLFERSISRTGLALDLVTTVSSKAAESASASNISSGSKRSSGSIRRSVRLPNVAMPSSPLVGMKPDRLPLLNLNLYKDMDPHADGDGGEKGRLVGGRPRSISLSTPGQQDSVEAFLIGLQMTEHLGEIKAKNGISSIEQLLSKTEEEIYDMNIPTSDCKRIVKHLNRLREARSAASASIVESNLPPAQVEPIAAVVTPRTPTSLPEQQPVKRDKGKEIVGRDETADSSSNHGNSNEIAPKYVEPMTPKFDRSESIPEELANPLISAAAKFSSADAPNSPRRFVKSTQPDEQQWQVFGGGAGVDYTTEISPRGLLSYISPITSPRYLGNGGGSGGGSSCGDDDDASSGRYKASSTKKNKIERRLSNSSGGEDREGVERERDLDQGLDYRSDANTESEHEAFGALRQWESMQKALQLALATAEAERERASFFEERLEAERRRADELAQILAKLSEEKKRRRRKSKDKEKDKVGAKTKKSGSARRSNSKAISESDPMKAVVAISARSPRSPRRRSSMRNSSKNPENRGKSSLRLQKEPRGRKTLIKAGIRGADTDIEEKRAAQQRPEDEEETSKEENPAMKTETETETETQNELEELRTRLEPLLGDAHSEQTTQNVHEVVPDDICNNKDQLLVEELIRSQHQPISLPQLPFPSNQDDPLLSAEPSPRYLDQQMQPVSSESGPQARKITLSRSYSPKTTKHSKSPSMIRRVHNEVRDSDALIKQRELVNLRARQNDVREWIETCTKIAFSDPDQFVGSLKDGVLLCHLINSIVPGAISTINRNRFPLFRQIENITCFIRACIRLGVKNQDLFEPTDLYEDKNALRVVSCIEALSRAVMRRSGYMGPFLKDSTREEADHGHEPALAEHTPLLAETYSALAQTDDKYAETNLGSDFETEESIPAGDGPTASAGTDSIGANHQHKETVIKSGLCAPVAAAVVHSCTANSDSDSSSSSDNHDADEELPPLPVTPPFFKELPELPALTNNVPTDQNFPTKNSNNCTGNNNETIASTLNSSSPSISRMLGGIGPELTHSSRRITILPPLQPGIPRVNSFQYLPRFSMRLLPPDSPDSHGWCSPTTTSSSSSDSFPSSPATSPSSGSDILPACAEQQSRAITATTTITKPTKKKKKGSKKKNFNKKNAKGDKDKKKTADKSEGHAAKEQPGQTEQTEQKPHFSVHREDGYLQKQRAYAQDDIALSEIRRSESRIRNLLLDPALRESPHRPVPTPAIQSAREPLSEDSPLWLRIADPFNLFRSNKSSSSPAGIPPLEKEHKKEPKRRSGRKARQKANNNNNICNNNKKEKKKEGKEKSKGNKEKKEGNQQQSDNQSSALGEENDGKHRRKSSFKARARMLTSNLVSGHDKEHNSNASTDQPSSSSQAHSNKQKHQCPKTPPSSPSDWPKSPALSLKADALLGGGYPPNNNNNNISNNNKPTIGRRRTANPLPTHPSNTNNNNNNRVDLCESSDESEGLESEDGWVFPSPRPDASMM